MRTICLIFFLVISNFSSVKSALEHLSEKRIQDELIKISNKNVSKKIIPQPYYQSIFQASSRPVDDLIGQGKMKRKAKWAKWLGIGSLVGLIIPGVNLLSLPAAIAAIVIGHQIPRESRYFKDAAVGRKTGWFTIIFLAVIAVIVLIVTLPLGPR